MSYHQKLQRNLTLFYPARFFEHLLFFIPIWVAFNQRYLNFTEMAFIYTFQHIIITFLEIPTGAIADLIGRRKTIMFGWIISSLGILWLPFATSLSGFIFGYALAGLGTALYSGADTALLYDTLKELNKEKEFSKFITKYGLGVRTALMVGAFFGGMMYEIHYSVPYFAVGIAQLLVAATTWLMVEPKIDSEIFTWSSYLHQTKQGWNQITKNLHMKKLSVYYILIGAVTWASLSYFSQPFTYDVEFNTIEVGYIFSFSYLVTAIILFAITHFTQLSRIKTYLLFPFLMILGFLPGIFATKWLTIFMIIFIQIAGSGRFALLDIYLNEEFPSQYRATALSTMNMMVSILVIALVGMGGIVQDLYNTKVIFTALGIFSLTVILPLGMNIVNDYRKSALYA